MRCVACQSDRQNDFPSEIALRFSGREDLEKQHVFLYPKVCSVLGLRLVGVCSHRSGVALKFHNRSRRLTQISLMGSLLASCSKDRPFGIFRNF